MTNVVQQAKVRIVLKEGGRDANACTNGPAVYLYGTLGLFRTSELCRMSRRGVLYDCIDPRRSDPSRPTEESLGRRNLIRPARAVNERHGTGPRWRASYYLPFGRETKRLALCSKVERCTSFST